MKAIVTVGVSASGKTIWAESQEWFVNINRDDIRFTEIAQDRDWSKYKFTKANEKRVTEIHEQKILDAARDGKDIIISDTNLNKNRQTALVDKLTSLGYEVELKFFPISYEEACKRDALRANGVGHSVIARQFEQWNQLMWESGSFKYKYDPKLHTAIIVDIDGTLAHMNGGRGAFEWEKVGQDSVDHAVRAVVSALKFAGFRIILMSGRDSVCRKETEEWLSRHGIKYDDLFMRTEGDMRKDTIVKRELFMQNVNGVYNVLTVIDDRPVVCREWVSMGLKVMQVGNPNIEF